MANVKFGKGLRISDFDLDLPHTFINHGSYGSTPRSVQKSKLSLLAETERNPDQWFRHTALNKWDENVRAAAEFLGAKPENLVIVNNATTGCNAVIKSLRFEPRDAILLYSYTYNAITKASNCAMDRAGGEVITVDIPLELASKDTILDAYREALEKHPNIKLVVLDLISSSTAILHPLQELIELCRRHEKLVLVDGAHAPGQVPLELETMGAHFFSGNLHKWCYAPRGCAVLWVHPDFHDVITPAMTSHGYKAGSIRMEFFNQATVDLTSLFCAEKALEYYNAQGGTDVITRYTASLLDPAVEMLTRAWGTKRFPISRELEAPNMRLLGLPTLPGYGRDSAKGNCDSKTDGVFGDLSSLMKTLCDDYAITAVCLEIYGKPWVRLSANIYNCAEDYEKLRDAILDIQMKSHDVHCKKVAE